MSASIQSARVANVVEKSAKAMSSIVGNQRGERLKNRIVVVLGGNHGVGMLISARCAKEGAHVVVVDSNDVENGKASDEQMGCWIQSNLDSVAEIERTVGQVMTKYGRIDVVINCLSFNVRKSLLEISEQDWDELWTGFGKSIVFTTKRTLEQMLTQERDANGVRGRYMAVLSIPKQFLDGTAYGMIQQMIKQLQSEMVQHGIVVNALEHGSTNMELSTAPVEGLANAALFLATDESSFVLSLQCPLLFE